MLLFSTMPRVCGAYTSLYVKKILESSLDKKIELHQLYRYIFSSKGWRI